MQEEKISTSDIIKDYDRIYSTSGIRTNSAYYRWIIKLFRPKPNTKILDVSCGEGILLRELEKLDKHIETYGLDISNAAVKIARRNSPKSRIVLADGQRIPFENKFFDYVTCLGSLEHYLQLDLGLKELLQVAKDESTFCIVLPNSFSIDGLLSVWKTGGRPAEDFQIIERSATKNEWIDLLIRSGFNVKSVYPSNLWPELFQEGTMKIKSLSKYFKRLLIKYLCPLNLAREFIFICNKKV